MSGPILEISWVQAPVLPGPSSSSSSSSSGESGGGGGGGVPGDSGEKIHSMRVLRLDTRGVQDADRAKEADGMSQLCDTIWGYPAGLGLFAQHVLDSQGTGRSRRAVDDDSNLSRSIPAAFSRRKLHKHYSSRDCVNIQQSPSQHWKSGQKGYVPGLILIYTLESLTGSPRRA
ncbi:hypothetical protein JHW43_001022 [Diplocarpon mali]|nr:hypothetical protein JHW43_001022 [Diplocarpon mali]